MNEYRCALVYRPYKFPCEDCTRNENGNECACGNKGEEKIIPHNKSCEYHGQNIEVEVLDAWVYPKSKIIELRCIDICKQCGEGYGKVYTLFADKFVKEV